MEKGVFVYQYIVSGFLGTCLISEVELPFLYQPDDERGLFHVTEDFFVLNDLDTQDYSIAACAQTVKFVCKLFG